MTAPESRVLDEIRTDALLAERGCRRVGTDPGQLAWRAVLDLADVWDALASLEAAGLVQEVDPGLWTVTEASRLRRRTDPSPEETPIPATHPDLEPIGGRTVWDVLCDGDSDLIL